jgi:predicted nucleic acid-binding protein
MVIRNSGTRTKDYRYTLDASVFVNAFNSNERGHTLSLQVVAYIREHEYPVVVPTLLLPEIASALARATDDSASALEYAYAAVGLPHLITVGLTPAMARQAAELAAAHRLRGADSVYVAVARRYGTILVSRDDEQLRRSSAVVTCQTPAEVLTDVPLANE